MNDEWKLYEAVIVAAGRSRRMGAFKPLLPLGDHTILERCVLNFREAGIHRITVVTGFRGDEIEKELRGMDVEFVHNPAYAETDMFTSVCLGVQNKRKKSKGILITPGDAPLIRPFTIKHVLTCMEIGKGEIIVPIYQGMQGHPPVFSGLMAEQMLQYQGGHGLRGFLDENQGKCFYTEVPDPWICQDTDTPEQYEKVKMAWEKRTVPNLECCKAIWDYANTPVNVRRHCEMVAETARKLCEILNTGSGKFAETLDVDMIVAGALLHDVKRAEPKHAKAGAEFLADLGFPKLAQITAAHTELLQDEITDLGPEVVVYLADRMVFHDKECRIQDRYKEKQKQMQGNQEGLQRLSKDIERCRRWCQWIKEATGYDLYE